MTKRFITAMFTAALWMTAHANDVCAPLPTKVQNTNVSYIDNRDALQDLDDQMLEVVNACLDVSGADKKQASCKNGRVAAEQVLRVIGRMDQAAKHNDFLKTAKLRSYKPALQLLERAKDWERSPDCRR